MRKNRLKELRESLQMSQEMLGQRVGISQQVISKIESDDARLTKDNLLVLSEFFHVSTDYFLGLSVVRRNEEQEHIIQSQYEKNYELLHLYELLEERDQKLVRCMVDKMVELGRR